MFVGRSKHRRVLGIGNGYVLYSIGSNTDRECKLATFNAWIRRQKAVRHE